MKYPYFRGLEADRYSFYRVPKALIKVDLFEKMSGDAKLLYAVLLDRMNLSLKNGWQDENGNAYIICTIDEIMDSIRCARQKAVKLLDELEHEYQLIERRRQGLGKPNLLYVKDLYAGLSQSNYWKYENQTSGGLKSELPGVWKSNGSKTDINNTDSSETDLIYSAQSGENISGEMREDERYRFYFQDKLEIPILEKNFPHDREILMEILELLVETVTSRKKFLRICGEEKPKEVVKSRLMKLDSMHIQYVMECLKSNTTRTGKIQCIVVKDLSRFGRDYIETGSYLETIFPMLHVRFIAINDDFDNIRQSDVDSLAVPIKNMVNSLYAKDISKKISLSYQMRREKGIPTSWCTPYGYRLNQQGNKLEATEDAKWVKLIYQWYLAGVSTNEIARRLEFLEVARPNERLNRKLHEGDDPTYNKWHPSTVLRILNSSAYIGELVSGKTQTASYKGIGLHPVEKREWHIVENAHEAIILKSDFEKVQARREQNKEKRERAMARSKATREKCYNHLSGMVYCGCCRRNMTFERRVHGTVKETHYGVFICKRKKNTTPCAYHAVPEKMLMMVAMDQIHHLVSTMCEEEKLVKDMMRGSNLDSARSIKMKEKSILFRIQEAEERRLRLYEDYKAEILDEDEYSQLKEHYIAEKQRLEHELQKQRQRALELEKRIKICDVQMERMRGILNQSEFDEELVHELIKKIYVGMDNSVEVEFKCSDPYQEVLAIMSEVQNE